MGLYKGDKKNLGPMHIGLLYYFKLYDKETICPSENYYFRKEKPEVLTYAPFKKEAIIDSTQLSTSLNVSMR